ncbi:DNA cytosine methyltransferase [Agrobacterium pusense]|uniref:DNA (cytosine-5-)-methyltransferase n=1 Tax=Agrobacterium pusense TaxID=648995 RepID=A0AA44ERR5_9HYPH|nr:DNA cytosine methyltransferase [Agrobacterium pusense]NRF12477.1 DNA cytosine methyltransferase [Agrobacterium pusense]NRF23187.1 DNA cytosine methyltransferase [Agrobacterium pusense]
MQHANDNHTGLRFLSVCSGIEAASVAWHPLGWQCIGVAEIEPFPAFVLAHHYGAGRPKYMPDPGEPGIKLKDQRSRKTALKAVSRLPVESVLTNWGDFTKIHTRTLGRVDILAGGTPCQAFSVAGLRQSLADARGNLSLEFVRLAHELAANNGLRNVVWENVVGVLSTKDNAFGCFLAGLVGADSAIEPPRRGKWARHGMVSGPKGRAAWAVKDGQFFGVAQRRRRVLVVADFGNGADPAAVLFEPESMFRDTPPSREKGKSITHPVAPSLVSSGRGIERTGDTRGQDPVVAVEWPAEVASTLNAAFGEKLGLENQHINSGAPLFVPSAVSVNGDVAHTLKAEGADASEDGTGRGTPIVAQSVAIRGRDGGATAELGGEIATALRASQGGGDKPHVLAQAYSIMPQNSGKDYKARLVDVAQPLMAGGPVGGNQGGDYIFQSAVRRLTPVECERLQGFPDGYTDIPWRGKPADQCPDGPRYKALGNSWAVPKFVWLGKRIQKLMPANDNQETPIANAA